MKDQRKIHSILTNILLFFLIASCSSITSDSSDTPKEDMKSSASLSKVQAAPMDAICDLSLFGQNLGDAASTTNTGDIDGDGYTDLIIGATYHNSNRGQAYLYYGGPNGLNSNPDASFDGEFESNLGWSIGIGDVDNDGYDDIILSGNGYDSGRGRAYLYWGASRESMDTRADLVFEGEGPKDDRFSFSWDQIPVEDIDGDGYADILMPATTYPTDVPVWSGIGRCYLYWGDTKEKMDAEADLVFAPPDVGGWFGVGLDIGDIDNDSYKDIVIGSITYPTKETRYGRAYLYWGSKKVTMDATADMTFEAENAKESQNFGVNVGIGDIDNDGHEDIVIGANIFNNTQGRAYLYWGASKARMDTDSDLTFPGEVGPGGFAELCICDGDVNADGYTDVLISARQYDNLRGRAYLYLGNTKKEMDAQAELVLTGENEGDWFGDPPGSSFGDFNNDGYDDLAIGAVMWQSNSKQGRVYVYHGGPTINVNDSIDGQQLWPSHPVHRAASDGDIDLLKSLILNGTNVNSRDEAYRTPIHSAVMKGNLEMVEFLIANGADINAKDKWGYRPMDVVCTQKYKEIVRLLAENGATISNIHVATSMGDMNKVKAFVQEGIDINAQDSGGYTPLHLAAQFGQTDIVEFLITHGADVKAKDRQNNIPLHTAATNGHKEIEELLIANGADVNAKNNQGQTPLSLAEDKGHTEIVELLKKHGAKE